MTEPTLPTTHSVGDTGHTGDHNTLVAALSQALAMLSQDGSSLATLQAAIDDMFSTAGGNVCAVPALTPTFAVINLAAIDRDNGNDTFDVFYGTQKVFSLNSYGDIVVSPSTTSHTSITINALPSQTADLVQLLSSTGSILSRVNSAGNLNVTNVYGMAPGGTQEVWNSLAVPSGASGILRYRMVAAPPNSAQLQGALTWNTVPAAGTVTLGTLPSAYQPSNQYRAPIGIFTTATGSGVANTRLQISTGGSIQLLGNPGNMTEADFNEVYPLN
jgi:hypothetical protein